MSRAETDDVDDLVCRSREDHGVGRLGRPELASALVPLLGDSEFLVSHVAVNALVALNARDYPLIQGITIVTATTFVGVNLAIDLAYPLIDPRIRLEA